MVVAKCGSANLKPDVSVGAGDTHNINDNAEASVVKGHGWIVAYTCEFNLDLLLICNSMHANTYYLFSC